MSQPKLSLSKFIRSMKTWISVLTIQFVELFLKSSSTTLLLKIDLANFVFLTELSSVALLVTESFLQLHLSQTWPNLLLSSQKMSWESFSFVQANQARMMLRQLISFLSYLSVMILQWWTHALVEFEVEGFQNHSVKHQFIRNIFTGIAKIFHFAWDCFIER